MGICAPFPSTKTKTLRTTDDQLVKNDILPHTPAAIINHYHETETPKHIMLTKKEKFHNVKYAGKCFQKSQVM